MTRHRLAKLSAMPRREIAHRVAYGVYTAWERRAHRRGRLAPPDRLRRGLVAGSGGRDTWADALVARRPVRFFAWADDPDAFRARFHEAYGPELSRARAIADAVARHEIAFFGETFRFDGGIDWHADPVTGVEWPRRYHRDVPVHGGNVGYGDVKHVWELNRHQFLVDLAKMAFLDRSARHAASLHALLRSWHQAVPYATGAAWACALEPAFRAWSWMWSYHLTHAAGLIDDETHLLWLTGLFDHGRFLYRHLETYSSPYNHLIGEAAALFALGVVCPEFQEAPAWRTRGQQVLETTVAAQFHPDGGSVEQSTFYHHATLGFYLLASILGRRNGVPLSRDVDRAIERGLEFSAGLIQPDGRLPRIGGADDGKPIRLEHLPLWDFRPYQAIGAVLFSRHDFRFVANRFWEDAFWLLGTEGAAAFERLPAAPPPTVTSFPASGYYVSRSDWSADADYLCVDCGPQAAGLRRDDIPSAAHGHADCLSVVVVLGGREVLVDPGFYCYNGDPEWEVHFRRTAAHNTIGIDERDQARHVSKMAWMRTFTARPEGWAPDEPPGWFQGSHDGFERQGLGVRHRRTVWPRGDGYVVLRDEIAGTPGHRVRAVFQFAPGHLVLGESSALFEERYELAWVCSEPVQPQLACGGAAPSAGWVATSLGVRHPAPRLTLEFTMTGARVVLLSLLADRRGLEPSTRQRVTTDGHTGDGPLRACVIGAGWVDEIAAGIDGPARAADVETDAPLVILRRSAAGGTDVRRAGGTRVALRDTEAARSRRPAGVAAR